MGIEKGMLPPLELDSGKEKTFVSAIVLLFRKLKNP
jgi:hypothetical protein